MGNAWFIAWQDVRFQMRQGATLVWVFLMPPVFFYFIGTVTGGFSGSVSGGAATPITVVADNPGFLSEQISLRLEEMVVGELSVTVCVGTGLRCEIEVRTQVSVLSLMTWSRSCQQRCHADTCLAGQTAIGGRHKGRALFVARQHQFDGRRAQGFKNIKVFFARHSKNSGDPFGFEGGNKQVRGFGRSRFGRHGNTHLNGV